ncbi:hypothetical protein K474DRAFT_1662982 [Panus rudis PR-1116 ss-1]|nr:hypothetical protein K474DRAFT_1662982 [Panus rudis PR-1116 ss-1]
MSTSNSIASLLPPSFTLKSYTQLASLWSNYGHIYRLFLDKSPSDDIDSPETLILKSIQPPLTSSLEDASESHVRKLISYNVERWFYHHLSSSLGSSSSSPSCNSGSVKVAKAYHTQGGKDNDGNLLLEDLSIQYPFDAHGSLGRAATECVLDWLAGFHGRFFRIHSENNTPIQFIPPPNEAKHSSLVSLNNGVWKRGTYYYLDTRREELDDMDEEEYAWLMPWVEKVNNTIDKELGIYGTLLHGDAKGANIIFNRSPHPSSLSARRRGGAKPLTPAVSAADSTSTEQPLRCALYDFQYVGLGLPASDLVYFLGTSIQSSLLNQLPSETELLRHYHDRLILVIRGRGGDDKDTEVYPFDVFWRHWELAIVDWYRFMAGWGFWGNDRWVEKRAKEIVNEWEKDGFPFD